MSDSEAKSLIKRLATNADVKIDEHVNQLPSQARNFFQWIETLQPKQIYKELPLMMDKEGQLISGIADLVIETDEQVVLIDYKTFTGDDAALRYKAKSFSGQLSIYEQVLRKYYSGKEIRMAIYFIMAGRLVWMKAKKYKESSL